MKVGDLVMFVDEGTYAKWFYGQLAICESSTEEKKSCRVRWLQPVKYYDRYTTISDFGWDKFEIYNDDQ